MHDGPIHERITALDARTPAETGLLMARVLRASWPGGGEDRSEPGALDWIRRWHPERIGVTLPGCSCALGHCLVCN
jgi:hypothetical protein